MQGQKYMRVKVRTHESEGQQKGFECLKDFTPGHNYMRIMVRDDESEEPEGLECLKDLILPSFKSFWPLPLITAHRYTRALLPLPSSNRTCVRLFFCPSAVM